MRILVLSSAYSGLTQRVERELLLSGHDLLMHVDLRVETLKQQLRDFQPDVVICPFLTQRIPTNLCKRTTFLIVHPGIEGDRGPSSLDWAIQDGLGQWGVTLLQADEEMDAGDVWGTATFPLREASKLSIYKREVSSAAVELIKAALTDSQDRFFRARPLDYTNPKVEGMPRPLMRQAERQIDWRADTTDAIVRKLQAADSSPGVKDSVNGAEVRLYGAKRERELRGKPGDLVAVHEDAVCRATVDGAVWIRQMKRTDSDRHASIKLPAAAVVEGIVGADAFHALPRVQSRPDISDVRVDRRGDVAYVHFDFYNGASSTRQCRDLQKRLVDVKQSDAKFVVFMGGEEFWSNGIHLNCIEAAEDPARESWENIQAMDDVVLEMITMTDQLTVSALRNNSGAGGSIMALAADTVVARGGTVHNPHYGSMGLYGSEYWTYLLPRRVGDEKADELMSRCEPLLAGEAVKIGFADMVFEEDWHEFHRQLAAYLEKLQGHVRLESFLAAKKAHLQAVVEEKPLEEYRRHELAIMRRIFDDPQSSYHRLRREFVYKTRSGAGKADRGGELRVSNL